MNYKLLNDAISMSIFSEDNWWGASLHQHSFGSSLSNLKREKRPNVILQNSKSTVEKALKWLVDTNVCDSIIISTFFENGVLNIKVNLKIKNEDREMTFAGERYDNIN